MTEREFYDCIGGNYEDALSRLMQDSLIRRFVLKFADDPNFRVLSEALDKGELDSAFSASHTLKGVALNLSFARLSSVLMALTDILRPQNRDDMTREVALSLFSEVQKEYDKVIGAIEKLK